MAKYWLQQKAPNGVWVDDTGSDEKENVVGYHKARIAKQADGYTETRVVERVDTVIWTKDGEALPLCDCHYTECIKGAAACGHLKVRCKAAGEGQS